MLPGAVAHAFVGDLASPRLEPDDRHHLERVLRVRPGDAVTVADGAGRWRAVRFAAGAVLEPAGEVVEDPAPAPLLVVAFALTKGGRPEVAVQKLTELGIDRIVPFVAARSVARWEGDRAGRHVERLRRVAREAAMQCRRSRLPRVDDVVDFATVAALPDAALAERDGDPPTLGRPTVLVGPEGGWAPGELAAGLPHVALGGQVLRAETAAIAAGTLFAALRERLVTEVRPGSRPVA